MRRTWVAASAIALVVLVPIVVAALVAGDGPSSVALLAAATMQDAQQLESLAPYAHVLLPASPDEQAMSPESTVLIARVPDLRLDGFELYGPEAALAAIWPGRRVGTAVVWTRPARLMRLPDALVDGAFARAAGLDPGGSGS